MERIRLNIFKINNIRDTIKDNSIKNSKEGENPQFKEDNSNMDTELPLIRKSNEILNKSSNKSLFITIGCVILGILLIIAGFYLFGTSSDKVVDNVFSGETATSSVILIILGFIIIAISVFISLSSKTSLGKTFDDIKDIEDPNYIKPKENSQSSENNENFSDTLHDIEAVIKSDFHVSKDSLTLKADNKNKELRKNIKNVLNSKNIKNDVTLDSFKNNKNSKSENNQKKELKVNSDTQTSVSFDEALSSVENLVDESESKVNNEKD